MSQKKKILVNGCSHTRACIPDASEEDHHNSSWPRVLENLTGLTVTNIATDAKANNTMIEETIRYLIHKGAGYDHAIVALTDWQRINVYKAIYSGMWKPNNFRSQLTNQNKKWYAKLPGLSYDEDMVAQRTMEQGVKKFPIGDSTYRQSILSAATLLYCLRDLCDKLEIKLTILNYHPFYDCLVDPVYVQLKDNFLIDNTEHGLYNHLLWSFKTPDTYHFEKNAHVAIAGYVMGYILYDDKLVVREDGYDSRNLIFDYG
tara:strand:- start:4230 stop:5006 length:777 start_codon:yes stop_codon:yes gene_type:complete